MKILIIGTPGLEERWDVALDLQAANEDLSVAPVFTTKFDMIGKTGERSYYMSNEEVELSYKNNAFMWVHTNTGYSEGVTMSDMYCNNVFVMTYADFNNISSNVMKELSKNDTVICVIDSSDNKKTQDDITEASNAFERIYSNHCLYFLDDKKDFIIDTVLKYIISSTEERENIEESLK